MRGESTMTYTNSLRHYHLLLIHFINNQTLQGARAGVMTEWNHLVDEDAVTTQNHRDACSPSTATGHSALALFLSFSPSRAIATPWERHVVSTDVTHKRSRTATARRYLVKVALMRQFYNGTEDNAMSSCCRLRSQATHEIPFVLLQFRHKRVATR